MRVLLNLGPGEKKLDYSCLVRFYLVFEILAHFYSLQNNCLFWFMYASITLCHFLHSPPTPTGTSTDNFLSCKWTLGFCGPSPSPIAQMRKWYRLGNVTEHSCHLIINSKTFHLFYTSYHISCWPQTLWRPSSWRCLESKEADACWCICYTLKNRHVKIGCLLKYPWF